MDIKVATYLLNYGDLIGVTMAIHNLFNLKVSTVYKGILNSLDSISSVTEHQRNYAYLVWDTKHYAGFAVDIADLCYGISYILTLSISDLLATIMIIVGVSAVVEDL